MFQSPVDHTNTPQLIIESPLWYLSWAVLKGSFYIPFVRRTTYDLQSEKKLYLTSPVRPTTYNLGSILYRYLHFRAKLTCPKGSQVKFFRLEVVGRMLYVVRHMKGKLKLPFRTAQKFHGNSICARTIRIRYQNLRFQMIYWGPFIFTIVNI